MEPDDHTRGALDMRPDDGRGGWPGVFLGRYRCVGMSIWFVSQFVCGTNCTLLKLKHFLGILSELTLTCGLYDAMLAAQIDLDISGP